MIFFIKITPFAEFVVNIIGTFCYIIQINVFFQKILNNGKKMWYNIKYGLIKPFIGQLGDLPD